MEKRCILVFLSICFCLSAFGQPEVRIGRHRFVPVRNVEVSRTRGATEDLGDAVGGYRNVLVQLDVPVAHVALEERLKGQGLELTDYLGGNAYYALLSEDVAVSDLRGSGVVSVMGVRPEWKVSDGLLEGVVPEHARVGSDGVRVMLTFAANADAGVVGRALDGFGGREMFLSGELGFASGVIPFLRLEDLASLPYVKRVCVMRAPYEVFNDGARTMSRASVVKRPAALVGRGLDGSGINVGIWDANVFNHPDFGARVAQQEYALNVGNHGTHVTGSLLGGGLLDEDGEGMAPGARAYTYNFGLQGNGKPEVLEMLEAQRKYGIALTSNSYGMPLKCGDGYETYSYDLLDQLNDYLAYRYDLLHVFAVGNDQDKCPFDTGVKYGDRGYGTVTRRTKNAILVGALKRDGSMTDFSSWGPQDDGRIAPTVCNVGDKVYSTVSPSRYEPSSGSSMATPLTSGSIALMLQRYRQLHGGAVMGSALARAVVANTAYDAGLPGPDFKYGFGILDIEHAVRCVENSQYREGVLKMGMRKNEEGKEELYVEPFKDTIQVPSGVKRVKVLLTWNDPTPDKEFAYGERSLTNDLDLVAGGHLPLYANPMSVSAPAAEAVDTINNIEQVVIDYPMAGSLPIAVSSKGLKTSNQPFALTWCFEYDELRIVSPSGGERLEPGLFFDLRLTGATEMFSVSVSYDGGKSFTDLWSLPYYNPYEEIVNGNVRVALPLDAPLTTNALLRVKTESGRIAVSELPFTIAPRVKNLRLIAGDVCSVGPKLEWDGVDGAEHGYVILRAGLSGGDFEIVERVGKGVTEYAVADALEGGSVYSVAVRTSLDGDDYGKRAFGVVYNRPGGVTVEPVGLPFTESFVRPSEGRFSISSIDSVRVIYIQDELLPSLLPTGSNVLVFQSGWKVTPADYDREKPFDNEQYVNRVRSCSFDLSAVDASKDLKLSVIAIVSTPNPVDAPKIRTLYGGEVLKDAHGREVVEGSGLLILNYPIRGGSDAKGVLDLQVVLPNQEDRVAIVALIVDEVSQEPNADIYIEGAPSSGRGLGVETVTCEVGNLSAMELKDVPVEFFLNNRSVGGVTIPSIAPMADAVVEYEVDFSSPDPLGMAFDLEARVSVDGDRTPHNNTSRVQVVNFGESVPMGLALFQDFFGSIHMQAYRGIRTLSPGEKVVFTDAGGAYGSYPAHPHDSWLKFKPSSPSSVLRARIVQLDLDEKGSLRVCTGDVSDELTIASDLGATLNGGEAVTLPLEFKSFASDGSLTFRFTASGGGSGAGWIIEIEELPRESTLAIVDDISIRLQGKFDSDQVPLSVKVQNLSDGEITDARAFYDVGWTKEDVQLETLQKGENEVVLGSLYMMARQMSYINVTLSAGSDNDPSDNRASGLAIYDIYPIPPRAKTLPDEGVDLGGVTLFDRAMRFDSRETRAMWPVRFYEPVYHTSGSDDQFVLFTGQKGRQIGLMELRIKKGYSAALFVDWDGDLVFEACDSYKGTEDEVTLIDEAIYFDLKGFGPDTKPGMKRARIVLGPDDHVGDPTFKDAAKREQTFVWDFQINVVGGSYEQEDDLELVAATFGTQDEAFWGKKNIDGESLESSDKTHVYLKLVNRGSETFIGSLNLHLTPDLPTVPSKDLFLPIGGAGVGPYGLDTVIMKVPYEEFDLRALAGKRKVIVELTDPGVGNDRNNKRDAELFVRIPSLSTDGLSAITFVSGEPKLMQDKVRLPVIPADHKLFNDNRGATLEFWMYPEGSQFGSPIRGHRQVEVYTTQEVMLGDIHLPDDAIVVILDDLILWTKNAVVTPYRWMHVALVFEGMDPEAGKTERVTMYINGEAVGADDINIQSQGAQFAFSSLEVAESFNGAVDEIRLWGEARSADEIKNNYERWLTADDDPKTLFYQFSLSEGPGNRLLKGHPVAGIDSVSAVLSPYDPVDGDKSERDGGVWLEQRYQHPVRSFEVEGASQVERKGNTYTVYLKKGTDWSAVSGRVETIWPGSAVSVGDTPNAASATALTAAEGGFPFSLDLTSSSLKNFFVKKSIFGHELSSMVQVRFVAAAGDGCELLSFQAGEASVNEIGALMRLELFKPFDFPPVVSFTVSEGAQLKYGNEVLISGMSTLDLSGRRRLTVVAEDGKQSQDYLLLPCVAQRIEGSQAAIELPYSDSVVVLDFVATSGLPLVYTSSDADVAVANGKEVHLTGPGEATITVHQPGNELYAAAEPKSFSVKVKKGKVTVTPTPDDTPYSTRLTWLYTYEGEALVNGTDEFNLPDAQSWAGWRIVSDADGKEYSERQLLPIGSYSLIPRRTKYEDARLYEVEAKEGKLRVVPNKKVVQAHLRVVESDRSTPVPEAEILLNGYLSTTDTNGERLLALRGTSYELEVRKAGYVMHRGVLEVDPGAGVQAFTFIMEKATHTVTYSSDGNGSISGMAVQKVGAGGSTVPVTAIPYPGYEFVKWSDGVDKATRHEENVKGGVDVSASFKKSFYEVRFTADVEGAFAAGSKTEQSVEYQADAEAVTLLPEVGDRYFYLWDDGSEEVIRTIKRVEGDAAYHARYAEYGRLGVTEGFEEATALPSGWYTTGNTMQNWRVAWRISSRELIFSGASAQWHAGLYGRFAVIDGNYSGPGGEVQLNTPRYLIDASTGDELELLYNYLLGSYEVDVTVSYRFNDDAEFKALGSVTHAEHRAPLTMSAAIAGASGKEWIQFRFGFKAKRGRAGAFAIDNFLVREKPSTAPTSFTVTFASDPADAGRFFYAEPIRSWIGPITGFEKKAPLAGPVMVAGLGGATPYVMVEPADGFEFLEWKDGEDVLGTTNVLYPSVTCYADRTITAHFVKKGSVFVSYGVYPAGAGTVTRNGKILLGSAELVEPGQTLGAVTAEATAGAGYKFSRWSVGSREAELRDYKPQRDVVLVAIFEPEATVPLQELSLNVSYEDYQVEGVKRGQAENAAVLVLHEGRVVATASTDARGEAKVSLPAGRYVVKVTCAGFAVAEQEVEVKEEKVKVSLVLRSGARLYPVEFVVLGADGTKLAAAQVHVDGEAESLTTNDEGVALGHFPYGARLSVHGTAEGYQRSLGVEYHVTSDVKGQRVTLHLVKGIQLKVTVVRDQDGTPLGGAEVFYGNERFVADENGVVMLVVPAGTVYLSGAAESHDRSATQAVTVEVGAESAGATIRLRQHRYAVTFRVVDGDSKEKMPLANARITLLNFNEESISTSSTGEAEYMLPTGEYAVRVECEGYDYIGKLSFVVAGNSVLVPIELRKPVKLPYDVSLVAEVLAGVTVRPNPFSGVLYLRNLEGVDRVEVYGLMGNRAASYDLSGESERVLSLDSLPSGVYVLRLMSGGQSRAMRVVKQ